MVKSQEKGLLMMSLFSFRELITTIRKGNIYAINTMIRPIIASAFASFLLFPPIVDFFIMLPPPASWSDIPADR